MRMKQMVEVKNAWKMMGIWRTVEVRKKKKNSAPLVNHWHDSQKGCKEWMVEVSDNNCGYWPTVYLKKKKG